MIMIFAKICYWNDFIDLKKLKPVSYKILMTDPRKHNQIHNRISKKILFGSYPSNLPSDSLTSKIPVAHKSHYQPNWTLVN